MNIKAGRLRASPGPRPRHLTDSRIIGGGDAILCVSRFRCRTLCVLISLCESYSYSRPRFEVDTSVDMNDRPLRGSGQWVKAPLICPDNAPNRPSIPAPLDSSAYSGASIGVPCMREGRRCFIEVSCDVGRPASAAANSIWAKRRRSSSDRSSSRVAAFGPRRLPAP